MSKKRLGGRRLYWPNHGKSSVVFLFSSLTTPKPKYAILNLEIKWRSYFDLLKLVLSVGTAFPRVFGMIGGYFRASKLRQAHRASEPELPSVASSNHLNQWIDCRSIYKTLKNHHHRSLHTLSRVVGVHNFAAHAPPLAAESQKPLNSSF